MLELSIIIVFTLEHVILRVCNIVLQESTYFNSQTYNITSHDEQMTLFFLLQHNAYCTSKLLLSQICAALN